MPQGHHIDRTTVSTYTGLTMLDLGLDLNVWPWIWLAIAVLFAIVELTILAGSFVLLPFALSSLVAALLGFYDVAVEVQWAVAVLGGALLWLLFYRYARRWVGTNDVEPGVGADRLVGLTGIVTTTIDPDDTGRRGRVAVFGETWGAITDHPQPIVEGTKVTVTAMIGTRVRVEPLLAPPPPTASP